MVLRKDCQIHSPERTFPYLPIFPVDSQLLKNHQELLRTERKPAGNLNKIYGSQSRDVSTWAYAELFGTPKMPPGNPSKGARYRNDWAKSDVSDQHKQNRSKKSHNSSTSWIICIIQIWNVYRLEFQNVTRLDASPKACTAFIFAAHTGWPAGASRFPPSCYIFFSGKPGVAHHLSIRLSSSKWHWLLQWVLYAWYILMYPRVSSLTRTSQYREHWCLCWRRSDFFSNASR